MTGRKMYGPSHDSQRWSWYRSVRTRSSVPSNTPFCQARSLKTAGRSSVGGTGGKPWCGGLQTIRPGTAGDGRHSQPRVAKSAGVRLADPASIVISPGDAAAGVTLGWTPGATVVVGLAGEALHAMVTTAHAPSRATAHAQRPPCVSASLLWMRSFGVLILPPRCPA